MQPTLPRRIVSFLVLAVCTLLILHLWGVEPFEVPTGSMAPALLGEHHRCDCPSCGFPVVVGQPRPNRSISCPNCGAGDLPFGAEVPGDRMLVNKSIFALRRPRRWEVVVFYRNGKIYVKRIIGLPGETVEIKGGDIYIDGVLCRKTLEDVRETRVLVHTGLGESKSGPLTSEYIYNGRSACAECIHDFVFEGDIEVRSGQGRVRIGLCDGRDEVVAELPVGVAGNLITWMRPATSSFADLPRPASFSTAGVPMTALQPGRKYRVEVSFVDRRLTVAVDGLAIGEPVDLPQASQRQPVQQPMYLKGEGCEAVFTSVRLHRDLHYTQAGTNAVDGKAVRLGPGQYFVLGDNSGNSEDSRYWNAQGVVRERDLVGKPFLVYLPSRPVSLSMLGRAWQCRAPDWSRIRFLR